MLRAPSPFEIQNQEFLLTNSLNKAHWSKPKSFWYKELFVSPYPYCNSNHNLTGPKGKLIHSTWNWVICFMWLFQPPLYFVSLPATYSSYRKILPLSFQPWEQRTFRISVNEFEYWPFVWSWKRGCQSPPLAWTGLIHQIKPELK